MTYADLLAEIKTSAPYDWPRLHGGVIAHRLACVRVIRARLEELLADPVITRRQLRSEMETVLKQVEEHGPG